MKFYVSALQYAISEESVCAAGHMIFTIKLQVYTMENVYTKPGRSVFAYLTLMGAI